MAQGWDDFFMHSYFKTEMISFFFSKKDLAGKRAVEARTDYAPG